ncbi:MAG: pyridoxamine 5'-phosphate oxidase [Ignavibacteriaceae bacterium]|nr:pyridoxamine 5'-phosphate oxidase [Ignavibacteriaceae bacterium]
MSTGTGKDLSSMRKNYYLSHLAEDNVSKDPFEQFRLWFEYAQNSNIIEPNSMILATADKKGIPNARVVLLKSFGPEGFLFYTNYESTKGKELLENPHAAIVFYWPNLERQLRMTGSVQKISKEESERYFQSRPRDSQIGTIVSEQSRPVENRQALEESFYQLKEELEGKEVPYPENWGGFRFIPDSFEFWQGRPNRLHDRIQYKIDSGNEWKILRLAP